METIQLFIDGWTVDDLQTKPAFLALWRRLAGMENAAIEFHERPGISYSLRGVRPDRPNRPLFVMIDVIDDVPHERWLSVCFYGDMIRDPKELGDLIPEGLLGSDGYCFDLSESDDRLVAYLSQRIEEAYTFQG